MKHSNGRIRTYEFNGETFSRGCLIGLGIIAIILLVTVSIILVSVGTIHQAISAIIALFSVFAIISISTLLVRSRKITLSIGIVEEKVVIVCKTIIDRFVLASPIIYTTTIGKANLGLYSDMICYQLELSSNEKTEFILKEVIKDNHKIYAPITQMPRNELIPSAYTVLSKAPYPGVAHKLYNLLKEIDHPDVVEMTKEPKLQVKEDVNTFDPFLE
ncbi:MAG TPA: hypothetical protein PKV16_04905 [Caldisericia bacterium]|nr:hypothetical protein [Caldisericia bacterium]HPF48651.1 hypothetical protein [Caldisericia bacterium]HPI83689.1 hypothetical protein [Caldisericia bacterium]HPQ93106.1 hypothetical protein [Caldisericia bacterium]HRV75061.1 hypothetical protein [Caldisericia bacterium]